MPCAPGGLQACRLQEVTWPQLAPPLPSLVSGSQNCLTAQFRKALSRRPRPEGPFLLRGPPPPEAGRALPRPQGLGGSQPDGRGTGPGSSRQHPSSSAKFLPPLPHALLDPGMCVLTPNPPLAGPPPLAFQDGHALPKCSQSPQDLPRTCWPHPFPLAPRAPWSVPGAETAGGSGWALSCPAPLLPSGSAPTWQV